jgi:hypothetical protein
MKPSLFTKKGLRGLSSVPASLTAMLEPRYVLEVARLLDQKGDRSAATAEYERFLELWKNADAGLPELEEAKQYLTQSSEE